MQLQHYQQWTVPARLRLGELRDDLIQALISKIRFGPELGCNVILQVLSELHDGARPVTV